MRRVDPRHRTLGQFFQDEIATPLGEDVYIRLPEDIPNARLATLSPPGRLEMFVGFRPVRLLVEGMNPRSKICRALAVNPGTSVYLDEQRVYARNLEVPAGGGVGTARAHCTRVQRVRDRRTRTGAATSDAGLACRPCDSSGARVL